MSVKSEPTQKTDKKKKLSKKENQLEKSIEELTLQLHEMEDKHLRLIAEFDNFRKRKDKEILQLLEYEGEDLIKKILPIIDDMNRMKTAVNHPEHKENLDSIRNGIELILQKISKLFEEEGVIPFCEAGDLLDVELHDALMTRVENDRKNNEILEVFEKGYRYKDRVIRHAKVVVNKE